MGVADILILISVGMAVLAYMLPQALNPSGRISPFKKQQVFEDLEALKLAIVSLESDSRQLLGLPGPNPCVNGPEFFVSQSCAQGLYCEQGQYQNWNGPYLKKSFSDPWGQPYFVDNDFKVKGRLHRVIGSFGPNGVQDPNGKGDDLVLSLCQREGDS